MGGLLPAREDGDVLVKTRRHEMNRPVNVRVDKHTAPAVIAGAVSPFWAPQCDHCRIPLASVGEE